MLRPSLPSPPLSVLPSSTAPECTAPRHRTAPRSADASVWRAQASDRGQGRERLQEVEGAITHAAHSIARPTSESK
eukprot:2915956-Rhodomonas_salina.1